MPGLPPIIVELKALTSEFSAKIGEAKEELHELETSGNKSISALQQGGKLATVALGAGFLAAAGLSVKAGVEYQESLTTVQNSAGLTDEQVKAVGDTFLDTMGKSTFSAQEMSSAFGPVAGVVKELNGGSLDAATSMEFMKGAMDLAEASGGNLTDTTANLSKVMLEYGLSSKDAGETSNVLYNTSKVTGVGLDQLSTVVDKMHMKLGPLAPTLADTSALLADMATHGVAGARGTAAASAGLTTLLSGTKPVNDELKKLGIEVTDGAGKFKGMGEIIAELQPKMAGMTDEQRLATEQTLFGKTAALALNDTLMAGTAGYEKAKTAVEEKGAVDEAAAKKAQTLGGQMKTVAATAEDLAAKFGMILIPYVQKAINEITSLTNWFIQHKTVALVLAGAVGGVLVTAIAAYVAGLVVAGVKSLVEFTKMGLAGAKWVLGGIAQFASWVAMQAASMAETAGLWALYAGAWLAEQASTLGTWIALQAMAFTEWVAAQATSIGETVGLWALYAGAWLAEQAATLSTWVALSAASAAEWVSVQAAALLESAAAAAGWAADMMASATLAAADWLASMAVMVVSSIASAAAIILPFLPLILTIGLIGIAAYELYTHWDEVFGFIKSITSDVWDFLKMIFGYIVEGGMWYIKTELSILGAVWSAVWGAITGTVSAVWGFLEGVFNAIVQNGIHVVASEIQSLEGVWSSVWGAISSAVSGAWDFISGIFSSIQGAISGVMNAIGGISSAASAVGGFLSHIPGFAGGVDNFGGGLAMVGEEGPELVNLPRGSSVSTAGETAMLLNGGGPRRVSGGGGGGGGGGGTTNVINLTVQGHIIGSGGESALVNMIHEGLLRKQAQSPLGLVSA